MLVHLRYGRQNLRCGGRCVWPPSSTPFFGSPESPWDQADRHWTSHSSSCSNIALIIQIGSFQLTSCASGRGLRGLRRRCWGLSPPLSPDPSPSNDWPSPSAGLAWSPGRGLRGKNRRRKRRLLGAYRLPLTGTPPGPVTLAASEPFKTPK